MNRYINKIVLIITVLVFLLTFIGGFSLSSVSADDIYDANSSELADANTSSDLDNEEKETTTSLTENPESGLTVQDMGAGNEIQNTDNYVESDLISENMDAGISSDQDIENVQNTEELFLEQESQECKEQNNICENEYTVNSSQEEKMTEAVVQTGENAYFVSQKEEVSDDTSDQQDENAVNSNQEENEDGSIESSEENEENEEVIVAIEEDIFDCEELTGNLYQDSDTLLSNYMGLGQSSGVLTFNALYSSYNGNKLSGISLKVYDLVKNMVEQLAAGAISDSWITIPISDEELAEEYIWSTSELGVDSVYADDSKSSLNASAKANAVALFKNDIILAIKSIIRDCPYEMFWFANTYTPKIGCSAYTSDGTSIGLKNMSLSIYMAVSSDYRLDSEYKLDTSKTEAVNAAIQNANSILGCASEMENDLDKMDYYRSQICEMVSYDSSANATLNGYGDPWQIVNVFDGDPSTNVVCEGYAKAFQYLCDQTSFNEYIYVISVSGSLTCPGVTEGGHLWNIIHYNGINYLADITNCDGPSPHANLFLATPSEEGNVEDGYTFMNGSYEYIYKYYSETRSMYADSELDFSFMEGHTHEWDEGVVTSPATCTHRQIVTYTCNECGAQKRVETGESAAHTEVIDPATEASCTTPGKTAGSHCSVCGAIIEAQTDVPALGHTVVTDPAVAATCTAEGKTAGSHCSVCGAIIEAQTDVPALGHTVVTDPAVAATCTAEGKTAGSHCSVCETVITAQTTIEALGHSWNKGEIIKAPSCQSYGTRKYTCIICGATKEEQIAKTAHTVVTDPAVSATLFSSGKTEGSHCSVCGTVITAQKIVAMKGLTRSLSYGMTGDDVKQLQQKLSDIGYYYGTIDGDFGSVTQKAVENYQTENALYVDGVVGELTLNSLRNWTSISPASDEAVGNVSSPDISEGTMSYTVAANAGETDLNGINRDLSLGCSGSDVEILQQFLNTVGNNCGIVDGYFGVMTQTAVYAYQAANGLYQDGYVGPFTLANMKVKTDFISASTSSYGSGTASASDLDNIIRDLYIECSGEDVKILQRFLNNVGNNCGTVDGYFGVMTQTAVYAYQAANGLYQDGYVGPVTLANMKAKASSSSIIGDTSDSNTANYSIAAGTASENSDVNTISSDLSYGAGGEDVKVLQRYLNAYGYNCGIVDGEFGNMTDSAVRAFQSDKGLYVDGVVGPLTRAAMK